MNILNYKEYVGIFEYEPEDRLFHGHVAGIRDEIHFCGSSVDELEQALAESVEEYLLFCKEQGKAPEKPCSGKFLVRISPELHRRVAVAAEARGLSMNAFVTSALERETGCVADTCPATPPTESREARIT